MAAIQTKVKCKKDLIHSDGSQCFTKGKTYQGNICNILENLTVTNNNGEKHRLGNWSKHFTNISKY